MNKKSLLAIVLVVVVGVVLLIVLKPKSVVAPSPATQPPSTAGPSAEVPPIVKVQAGKIDVKMALNSIEPKRFSVTAGKSLTINVVSSDNLTHVFKFVDPSLADTAVGVGGGEQRSINFTVPSKKGEYIYFCDVPGHRGRGEEGVMVVE